MGKTREIKKRIKAVGNIQRITRTMQMIATSKFSRSQSRAMATKPYTEGVFELVRDLATNAENASHPLIDGTSEGQGKPELTLILTSDRGLCGPYNGSILRSAMNHLRSAPAAKDGSIELVGKKGVNFLKFNNIPVSKHYTHFTDTPTLENVEKLANEYMTRFIAGEVSAIRVIFMKFITVGKQTPTVMQLLPLKSDATAANTATTATTSEDASRAVQYEFSPHAPELLGDLLPAAVRATLFQAFLDAVVSEHVARMVAMKAATDNAGKMGKNLKRVYNRARQAQITTELTEIISGAAALE